MTLIVGIRCSDGIIMAADSASTLGSAAGHTIAQETDKLEIIDGSVIVGCSGAVGMAQRFQQCVEQAWKGTTRFENRTAVDAGVIIGTQIKPHIAGEMEAAQYAARIGVNAGPYAGLTAIVALPVAGQLHLIEFNEIGGPEIAPPKVPFVAIGSGKTSADPFLGFLRRIFWTDKEPTLGLGTFTVIWTLDQCIRTSPAYLARPVQVAELKLDGLTTTARMLSPGEIEEHRESIELAEQATADYKNAKAGEPPP